jgi:hypothetical protein
VSDFLVTIEKERSLREIGSEAGDWGEGSDLVHDEKDLRFWN